MRDYILLEQDITTANVSMICHQVNCMGKMRSGVAKCIREAFPNVYDEYIKLYNENIAHPSRLLGNNQYIAVSDGYKTPYYVCNMFAQESYGYDGKTYTSISAFQRCLLDINRVSVGCTVAFPWKIGCVRGGANWNEVLPLILNTLTSTQNIVFCKQDRG